MQRFLLSAAVQAAQQIALAWMTYASAGGLIQVIIANFVAVIHSQNYRLDYHDLAIIVTQPRHACHHPRGSPMNTWGSHLTSMMIWAHETWHASGIQKPSDDLDMAVVVSLNRAQEVDYRFLSNVLQEADSPEYNGLNTQVCRESGM